MASNSELQLKEDPSWLGGFSNLLRIVSTHSSAEATSSNCDTDHLYDDLVPVVYCRSHMEVQA